MRVRYWRRRWCIWRGHTMAEWSPIVVSRPARHKLVDGAVIETQPEYVVRQWRCSIHDKENHHD